MIAQTPRPGPPERRRDRRRGRPAGDRPGPGDRLGQHARARSARTRAGSTSPTSAARPSTTTRPTTPTSTWPSPTTAARPGPTPRSPRTESSNQGAIDFGRVVNDDNAPGRRVHRGREPDGDDPTATVRRTRSASTARPIQHNGRPQFQPSVAVDPATGTLVAVVARRPQRRRPRPGRHLPDDQHRRRRQLLPATPTPTTRRSPPTRSPATSSTSARSPPTRTPRARSGVDAWPSATAATRGWRSTAARRTRSGPTTRTAGPTTSRRPRSTPTPRTTPPAPGSSPRPRARSASPATRSTPTPPADGTPIASAFLVTFDRPIDPASFTAADAVVMYRDTTPNNLDGRARPGHLGRPGRVDRQPVRGDPVPGELRRRQRGRHVQPGDHLGRHPRPDPDGHRRDHPRRHRRRRSPPASTPRASSR